MKASGTASKLFGVLFAGALTLLPTLVSAQNDFWTGAAGSSLTGWQFNNWGSGQPTSTSDVLFNANVHVATITTEENYTIQSITFTGNLGMTFDMQNGNGGGLGTVLTLNGAGLSNQSSTSSYVENMGGAAYGTFGGGIDYSSGSQLVFNNSASSGNVAITNDAGYNLGDGYGYGANITYNNTATAGTSVITNSGSVNDYNISASIDFNNSSSASSATIKNNGGNGYGSGGSVTSFSNSSTAGSATIYNYSGIYGPSYIQNFGDIYGTGAGGITYFNNTSSAGSAYIETDGNGAVYFKDTSSGGTAQINNNGVMDISYDTAAGGVGVGSIAGSGVFELGGDVLTVGSLNTSTYVWGPMVDGGSAGGTGGSLVKVGSGTLTLEGDNSYTGGTTIDNGEIYADYAYTLGTGTVTVSGGTLTLPSYVTLTNTLGPLTGGGVVSGGTITNTSQYNMQSGSVSTVLAGTAGLAKTTSGTVTLTGDDTYTGTTYLAAGTLAVSGQNAEINSGAVFLGDASSVGTVGTLQISGGGQVNDSEGFIGSFGSSGLVTVTDVGASGHVSSWSNSSDLFIGYNAGTGTLNVLNGGSVSSTADTYIGYNTSGGAIVSGVNANGTASTLKVAGSLYVGYGGAENATGELDIENGAVVNVGSGAGTVTLASYAGTPGTLDIGDGGAAGTLQAAAVTGGLGTAQVIFGETDSSYKFAPQLTGSLSVSQSGTGTTVLTGSNTYTGGTSVTHGGLLMGNGANGSATGSGTLTVASGATIGGAGTSNSAKFSISGSVLVGNGTDVTSQTTITAESASTLSGGNLTFNLGVGATQGESNTLNLGATPVTFNNVTLTLNIVGAGIIQADTSYLLITTDSLIDPAADGLTVGANGQITGGLTIATTSVFGNSTNGYSSGFYNGSHLYVSGDNIYIEVAPEPSTWAMLLGGAGLLFFWQKRARRARY